MEVEGAGVEVVGAGVEVVGAGSDEVGDIISSEEDWVSLRNRDRTVSE